LNRRFKRVFAYFWREPKVGAESGAAQVPGRFEKNSPFAAKGGEDEINREIKIKTAERPAGPQMKTRAARRAAKPHRSMS